MPQPISYYEYRLSMLNAIRRWYDDVAKSEIKDSAADIFAAAGICLQQIIDEETIRVKSLQLDYALSQHRAALHPVLPRRTR